MTPEQEKVRSLLTDTITLLCRNGLTFMSDVKLQGLLAITIDSKEFFVVQIDETLAENLAESQVDCGQPEPLVMSQTPLGRKCQPQNARTSCRKRAQPVSDELSDCKSFCPESSQKDLAAGNFPDRFSDNLSSISAQVKVEDDDLMLLDSSGNSIVSQSYNYRNTGGDFRPSRKDFCDNILTTGATPGPSRSNHVKQRHDRKRTGQWNTTFEGIEWTGQGDMSSLAVNYGLDEMEDKHQPESQQDMTEVSYDEVYDLETGDEYSSEASVTALTYACQYDDCDKAFGYKRSLVRHQRQIHGCIYGAEREVTYFCHINGCPSTFRSEAALCRHRNKAHSQPD